MGSIKEAALRLSLVDAVSGPAKRVLASMKTVQAGIRQFNRNADAANQAFRGAVAEAALFGATLIVPIRAAARLEDAMADVAKVSSLSGEALAGLRSRLIQISREVPMAADELAGLAAELAAAGTADEDLERMTMLVARAGTAFGITGQEAGENLGKIRAALGLTVPETEQLADQMNALSDGTASSATDLLDFQRRVGSMGKQYGYTTDQVLAVGSAMISAGATAEQAATGFQAVGRALVKGSAATGTQEKAYKRLGLTSKVVAKSMAKDALETTQDVLKRIRDLPAWERASVMNQLFGDEARTFLPLVENTGLLGDSLKILADEGRVSGSVMREFQTRIGTTSGKLKILRNRAMAAGIAFGNALLPAIKDGADGLGGYVDQTSKFIETNQELVARVAKVSAGMVAARVALTGVRAGMYALVRPSNLLIAGLGYLAYTNFDQLSGAFRELKALATDLAGTQFVKSFMAGAGESLKAMGEGAQRLIGALRELSVEGSGLRAWLDSMEGGGWGAALGKDAVSLGALGAAAGAVGMAVGPLRTFGRVVLWLSGIKPALGLLKWMRGMGKASSQLSTAGAEAGTRFGTSFAGAARAAIARAGLGAWLVSDLVAAIPSNPAEFEKFVQGNATRWQGYNKWLEDNVGTPRTWLGLDKPATPSSPGLYSSMAMDAARGARSLGFGRSTENLPGKTADDLYMGYRGGGGGNTQVNAPVEVPISVVLNGVMLDQVISIVRTTAGDTARRVFGEMQSSLDAQLNRSSQTQFGGIEPYGD